MTLSDFLDQLKTAPDTVEFSDTMAVIETCYSFTETAFTNGEVKNDAGQNSGSCKIFAFGQLNALPPAQTLACFGAYYRDDVLGHPDGTDHGNIRNFMKFGWDGITFAGQALSPKT